MPGTRKGGGARPHINGHYSLKENIVTNTFDVVLVDSISPVEAIANGVHQASMALFDSAVEQPFVAAAAICVGAAALYGTAKAIEAVAPAVTDAFFQTAFVVCAGFDSVVNTIGGWFTSSPDVVAIEAAPAA